MLAHLDLDAFFAAVELHRRPELRGKPLVVGGDPRGRGVVSTASYDARRYGIHSAMSCAEALRRCPTVVFVRPDIAEYRTWSRRVWSLVAELSPTVEQVGIDEGYLELPPGDALERATAIQQAIRRQVRLSCSMGVASCKVVAKIASDMRKPGGITHVPSGQEAAFLEPLAVRKLPGVGPKSEARLIGAGIETIGGIAALDDARLREVLGGRWGEELRDRARGIDPRPVLAEQGEAISMSTEETFERDISDRERLHLRLHEMAAEMSRALRKRDLVARTVTTKLRYPDFSIVTRSHTAPVGIDDAETIGATAAGLLDRALEKRPDALRLIGVGVSGFERHRQLTLLDEPSNPALS